MSNKASKRVFRIYPGITLQEDLDEIRAWCEANEVVFSSLLRGRIRELIQVFKDNPENLKKY